VKLLRCKEPTLEQIQSYIPRLGGRNVKASRLVALTNTPAVFAATRLAELAAPSQAFESSISDGEKCGNSRGKHAEARDFTRSRCSGS